VAEPQSRTFDLAETASITMQTLSSTEMNTQVQQAKLYVDSVTALREKRQAERISVAM